MEAQPSRAKPRWRRVEDSVKHCVEGESLLLTGFPGTGKTHLAKKIVEAFESTGTLGLVAQTRKTAEQALQCHLAGHRGIDSTRYHRSGGASTSERPGGASRGGVKPRDLPCERAQINERENRRLEASRGRMRRKPCRSGLLIRAGGQRKAVRNLEEESAWN